MTTGIATVNILNPEGDEAVFRTRVSFNDGTWQEAAAATIEVTMPWLTIQDYVEFEEIATDT